MKDRSLAIRLTIGLFEAGLDATINHCIELIIWVSNLPLNYI
jgi:hypothetical protein